MKKLFLAASLSLLMCGAKAQLTTNAGMQYLLNQGVDMSAQFYDLSNTVFTPEHLVSFDEKTGEGVIEWGRYQMHPRQAFNANGYWITPLQNLDFPEPAYDQSPQLSFRVEPVNERVIRLRVFTSPILPKDPEDDVMLVAQPRLTIASGQLQKLLHLLNIRVKRVALRFSRILGESLCVMPMARN